MTPREIIIQIFGKVCDEKLYFNIHDENKLFSTYDDSTGQREC